MADGVDAPVQAVQRPVGHRAANHLAAVAREQELPRGDSTALSPRDQRQIVLRRHRSNQNVETVDQPDPVVDFWVPDDPLRQDPLLGRGRSRRFGGSRGGHTRTMHQNRIVVGGRHGIGTQSALSWHHRRRCRPNVTRLDAPVGPAGRGDSNALIAMRAAPAPTSTSSSADRQDHSRPRCSGC